MSNSFDINSNPPPKNCLIEAFEMLVHLNNTTTKSLNTVPSIALSLQRQNSWGCIVENNPLVACNIVDVNVSLINVYKTNTKTSSKRSRKANIEVMADSILL